MAIESSDPVSSPREGEGTPSTHVRAPRQKRSRRTLERLVGAALSIIEEQGVGAVTVQRVVERADSSVGSFYARFDGKDELLLYLEERVWEEARHRWESALSSQSWENLTLEGVVASVVRLLARTQEEDAGTRRALGREQAEAGIGEEETRFHARMAEDVSKLLLQRVDQIGHPQPERAARVAYRWAVSGIRELSMVDELEPADVIEEVSRGLIAYLGGGTRGDAEEPEEEVEFFDVWQ